jgi:tRNA 2-thiouridine synthesizing protein A
MSITVDARGLSCPQPVLMTINAIKSGGSDEIIIVVDNETAKENVCRAATGRGWTIADIRDEPDGCGITINKG